MSAEVLREAAALMRERAGVSAAGPWSTRHEAPQVFSVPLHDHAELADEVADCIDENDATHIASWHPAVALLVARWMEHEANKAETDHGGGVTSGGPCMEAVFAARAYLGESA